jgi:hypothetical protein
MYIYIMDAISMIQRERKKEREMCHCINKEKTNEKTNFTRNN